ncbi:hypothetical protein [Paludibacterium denitrificans]|uniref:hypothetical protein n=1 Tax=Paludibacterium denitrificans TaxID=2675226 RepID=UPI001E5A346A|nr:hypothetical protein [Paludibacterium denitrificans]
MPNQQAPHAKPHVDGLAQRDRYVGRETTGMSSVQDLYQQKLTHAAEAIGLVRNGDSIIVPTGIAEPPELLTALSENRTHFRDVKVWQLLAMGNYAYLDPQTVEHVRHVSYFLSGTVRKGCHEGWIDLLPNHFSEIPRMIKREEIPADVVFSRHRRWTATVSSR